MDAAADPPSARREDRGEPVECSENAGARTHGRAQRRWARRKAWHRAKAPPPRNRAAGRRPRWPAEPAGASHGWRSPPSARRPTTTRPSSLPEYARSRVGVFHHLHGWSSDRVHGHVAAACTAADGAARTTVELRDRGLRCPSSQPATQAPRCPPDPRRRAHREPSARCPWHWASPTAAPPPPSASSAPAAGPRPGGCRAPPPHRDR